jgi:hypothetical protein
MSEALEEIRQESKMKSIYDMAFDGDSANEIAKKLKVDVATVKKVLGEKFTKKDFDDNEDENQHSLNAYELAKLFGTPQEKAQMKAIMHRNEKQGYTSSSDSRIVTSIQSKYFKQLESVNEENCPKCDEDPCKCPNDIQEKEIPSIDKDNKPGVKIAKIRAIRDKESGTKDKESGTGKDVDKIKLAKEKDTDALEKQILILQGQVNLLKQKLEAEKNATVKPEPNPETGEVPLTIGVAHKYLKAKKEKEGYKKEELEESDDFFATVHSDKKEIADFIKKNKSGIDYVDDDAGGNIEFEGKKAHALADKVKAKFGVRVTKEEKEVNEYFAGTNRYKAIEIIKKYKGNYTKAYNEIEKLKPGLTLDPLVSKELKRVNTEEKELQDERVFYAEDIEDDASKMSLDKFIKKYADDFISKNMNYVAIQQKLKGMWQQHQEGGPGSGPQDGDKRGKYDTKGHTTDKPKGFFAKIAQKYIDKSNKKYADRQKQKDLEKKHGALGALSRLNTLIQHMESIDLQEMDVKFIYDRNPDKFQKILDKHNKASTRFPNPGPLKNKASPGLKGLWILGGDSVDILDFMKSLNKVGIEPKTKILKAGYGEEKTYKNFVKEGTYHIRVEVDGAVSFGDVSKLEKDLKKFGIRDAQVDVSPAGHDYVQVKTRRSEAEVERGLSHVGVQVEKVDYEQMAHDVNASRVEEAINPDYARIKGYFKLFPNKADAEKKAKEIGGKLIPADHYRKGHYAVHKESVKKEGGPGSGPQDGDKRGPYDTDGHSKPPSSKYDKVSNIKSFGKNIKGVSSVRQDGNRLEFDTSDGTATAREILKKFGKGRVKVTSMPDDDDPEMSATVVVTPRNESVQESLLNKDGKPSMGKLKSAIDDVNNTKSMAGDKFGITNIDYREKNGKKFLDVEVEDEKGLLNALRRKYGNKIKLRGISDFYIEEVQEADLTDKQVDMVKKVADKLPKNDFKKRYGKDAENVKFGTATNIVKKKLNIDGYEGARNLVDRLLKGEN